ncbi:hypothetical protein PC116_g161 [Phytophthora cactorum]|nr:hypothetical protein PC122_g149 [Phytophthora cactorum]KAG4252008.1 hypothetical protein PC116_g161 [Phytophthora cactorum]
MCTHMQAAEPTRMNTLQAFTIMLDIPMIMHMTTVIITEPMTTHMIMEVMTITITAMQTVTIMTRMPDTRMNMALGRRRCCWHAWRQDPFW